MARKKQRKRSRLRIFLLLSVIPFLVWFAAFFVWFYWYDLNKFFVQDNAGEVRPRPAQQSEKDERRERMAPPSQSREKIFDEDRKQLDELLKRRN